MLISPTAVPGVISSRIGGLLFCQIYRHSIEGSIPENVLKLINRAERLKGLPPDFFNKEAKEYGGPLTLKKYKNTTIVIDDQKLIQTLLDKRNNIYSHRPVSLVSHLITQRDDLLVIQYGVIQHGGRSYVKPPVNNSAASEHRKAKQMLHDYLTMPVDHMLKSQAMQVTVSPTRLFLNIFYLMDKGSLVQELGTTPPVDSCALLR
ncbi:hypothetical protein N7527_005869 [Penicillium freii]|nr:hypothetical protein N7527_005869 [Penicillium freii]